MTYKGPFGMIDPAHHARMIAEVTARPVLTRTEIDREVAVRFWPCVGNADDAKWVEAGRRLAHDIERMTRERVASRL